MLEKSKSSGSRSALTDQQAQYVEAYCTTLDPMKAAKAIGAQYPRAMVVKMNRSKRVMAAIKERMEERRATFWLKEENIMQKLWEEANREGKGSSHAARIQALVWLGKHLGMFQEGEQRDLNISYNIVNYASPEKPHELALNGNGKFINIAVASDATEVASSATEIITAVNENKQEVLEQLPKAEKINQPQLKVRDFTDDKSTD